MAAPRWRRRGGKKAADRTNFRFVAFTYLAPATVHLWQPVTPNHSRTSPPEDARYSTVARLKVIKGDNIGTGRRSRTWARSRSEASCFGGMPGDHLPDHIHVFRNGQEIGQWDIEH